jgi:hypothetical protein
MLNGALTADSQIQSKFPLFPFSNHDIPVIGMDGYA